jgi:hypothetical protein
MVYSEFDVACYGIDVLDKIPEKYFNYKINGDTKYWKSTFYIMNGNVAFFENPLGLGHYVTFNYNIKEDNIHLTNETGYIYKKYENIDDIEIDVYNFDPFDLMESFPVHT